MADSQIFGPRPEHGNRPTPTRFERDEYHDFLETFIASEFFDSLPEETKTAVQICRDTLCWTLGHENSTTFETNIMMWSEYFKDQLGLHDSFNN